MMVELMSIIAPWSENEEVSKTLCYCSLGHAKIAWEAIMKIPQYNYKKNKKI
jgi:hypothetical protein